MADAGPGSSVKAATMDAPETDAEQAAQHGADRSDGEHQDDHGRDGREAGFDEEQHEAAEPGVSRVAGNRCG